MVALTLNINIHFLIRYVQGAPVGWVSTFSFGARRLGLLSSLESLDRGVSVLDRGLLFGGHGLTCLSHNIGLLFTEFMVSGTISTMGIYVKLNTTVRGASIVLVLVITQGGFHFGRIVYVTLGVAVYISGGPSLIVGMAALMDHRITQNLTSRFVIGLTVGDIRANDTRYDSG